MENQSGNEGSFVRSYLVLRRAIGVIGFLLPIVVASGAYLLFQTGLQRSISSYYYTDMRDVFVGSLCAIGIFLFSYRGYERSDDIAGNLGGVFAIGVALFPTAPVDSDTSARFIGYAHCAFTILFFATFIYFSLCLFTKTKQKHPSARKLQRNRIYKACGCTMGGCILLIGIYFFLLQKTELPFEAYQPVYWLETFAIFAFGISWFIKGETILRDNPD